MTTPGSAPGRRLRRALDRENGLFARPRNEVHLAPRANCRAASSARLLDDLRRRRRGRRLVGERPAAVFLDADGHRLVATAVQVCEDGRCRGERDFVLARSAAVEHTNRTRFTRERITGVRSGPSRGPKAISLSDVSDRSFQFHVLAHDGAARRGEMRTPHGIVQTPAFMPVGTQRRGQERSRIAISRIGPVWRRNHPRQYLPPLSAARRRSHRARRRPSPFIGWDRPILTDSGGYQIFSLADRRRISEEGAEFRSHLDGSLHLLTPERATDIQAQLGSDIAMVLDECIATPATVEQARVAMERSVRWAARARAAADAAHSTTARRRTVDRDQPGQAQFGIIQGGIDSALRTESVQATVEIGFEAYAIGGLSVGEPPEVTYDVVAHTAPQLPGRSPRYLMGSGMPDDLFECVARGIDLFDCVLPTRNARNGQLLTRFGPICHQERPLRRRPPAARPRLRLLHLPALLARLSPPPLYRGRDDGGDAQNPA